MQHFLDEMQQRAVQVRRLAASVAIGALQRGAAVAADRTVVVRRRRPGVCVLALRSIDSARDRRSRDQRAGCLELFAHRPPRMSQSPAKTASRRARQARFIAGSAKLASKLLAASAWAWRASSCGSAANAATKLSLM